MANSSLKALVFEKEGLGFSDCNGVGGDLQVLRCTRGLNPGATGCIRKTAEACRCLAYAAQDVSLTIGYQHGWPAAKHR